MWILVMLVLSVPISAALWVVFSLLKGEKSVVWCNVAAMLCGIFIATIPAALLQSPLRLEMEGTIFSNAVTALYAPVAAVQAMVQEFMRYGAGEINFLEMLIAASYYFVPMVCGAVIGWMGGYWLASSSSSRTLLKRIVVGILVIAAISLAGMFVCATIDFVVLKLFDNIIMGWIALFVILCFFGGGGFFIIIGIGR